ncbi:hypothetical protein HanIR_Chr15g0774141 [Helianthus annuus]|nr:hypothetical protein HanIR_Chr15g0774141 [Helianthus annuus]
MLITHSFMSSSTFTSMTLRSLLVKHREASHGLVLDKDSKFVRVGAVWCTRGVIGVKFGVKFNDTLPPPLVFLASHYKDFDCVTPLSAAEARSVIMKGSHCIRKIPFTIYHRWSSLATPINMKGLLGRSVGVQTEMDVIFSVAA